MPAARLSAACACLVLVLCSLALTARAQTVAPPITPTSNFLCVPVERISFCASLNYTNVSIPNLRNQVDPDDISSVLITFDPLVRIRCSEGIVHLLCSVFAPFCDIDHPEIRVRPCRSLCQFVRNTCEDTLIQFGFRWPDYLDCNTFPVWPDICFGPAPENLTNLRIPQHLLDPNVTFTLPTATPPTTASITPSDPSASPIDGNFTNDQCPINLQVTTELTDRGYFFNGIKDCGVPCRGVYFARGQRDVTAPIIILLFAIACVFFTLFTVATFLIDRRRFHYPERPIIFLSFCYLIIALAYVVGTISKLVDGGGSSFACSDHGVGQGSFVFQRLPNDAASYRSASCVILFVLVYFFQMASAIWWVILTLTWFLAAALKWGEEAVEKLWLLYHIIAWSVPAIQVILVLALRLVDGDQLSGLCYTGSHSLVAQGVFVFTPLTIYLVAGLVFFAIGFTALINIHRQVQRDPSKAGKIGRLIVRVAVYTALYSLPNFGLLFLYMYELAQRGDWEMYYVVQRGCVEGISEPCSSKPTFAAFLLKYIFLFLIGIFSSSWVISQKTFTAWQKFFCSCGCRVKPYGTASNTTSPMHDKPKVPPHQTAV